MEWIKKDNKLYMEFNFNSQTGLASFLLDVAKLADEMNHHPDIKVSKATKLELELTTHDVGNITELDYKLAEKILNLLNKL